MFEKMYDEYNKVVLHKKLFKWIKGKSIAEKLGLYLSFLSVLCASIFSLNNLKIFAYISYAVMGIGLFVFAISENKEKIKYEKGNSSIVSPRFVNTIEILEKYGIDVTDEEQLDKLIEKIKREQTEHTYMNLFIRSFKYVGITFIIPVITVLLDKIFDNMDLEKYINAIIKMMIFCFLLIILVIAFYQMVSDFSNSRNNNLKRFIRDVDDIKIFSSKAFEVKKEITSRMSDS